MQVLHLLGPERDGNKWCCSYSGGLCSNTGGLNLCMEGCILAHSCPHVRRRLPWRSCFAEYQGVGRRKGKASRNSANASVQTCDVRVLKNRPKEGHVLKVEGNGYGKIFK